MGAYLTEDTPVKVDTYFNKYSKYNKGSLDM